MALKEAGSSVSYAKVAGGSGVGTEPSPLAKSSVPKGQTFSVVPPRDMTQVVSKAAVNAPVKEQPVAMVPAKIPGKAVQGEGPPAKQAPPTKSAPAVKSKAP